MNQHCAFDNCTHELSNSRGGSLCDFHHNQLAAQCLVHDCNNQRVNGTCACQQHQPEWNKYKKNHGRQSGASSKAFVIPFFKASSKSLSLNNSFLLA